MSSVMSSVMSNSCDLEIPKLALYGLVVGKKLGRGAQGVVYICKQASVPPGFTNPFDFLVRDREYAIKALVFGTKDEQERKQCCDAYKKEFDLVKNLSHPNMVKYHHLFIGLNKEGESIGIFLLMDHVPGVNLFSAQLTDEQIFSVFETLVGVLQYLQTKNLYHGDIKLENVMFDPTGGPVLIDFGLSDYTWNPRVKAGTPIYTPPHPDLDKDIWALGILICELCGCDIVPPKLHKEKQILKHIQTESLLLEEAKEFWFFEIIQRCLNREQSPTVDELMRMILGEDEQESDEEY
jgi:serine/threonine-protein kinase PpkA